MEECYRVEYTSLSVECSRNNVGGREVPPPKNLVPPEVGFKKSKISSLGKTVPYIFCYHVYKNLKRVLKRIFRNLRQVCKKLTESLGGLKRYGRVIKSLNES